MTIETTSPHAPERMLALLNRMRSGMSVMKVAMESCEGVVMNPEMLDFLDQWLDNIDEMKSCAGLDNGHGLSA